MAICLGSTEINSPTMLSGIGEIRLGNELIWQSGLPVGTTFDFDYTGKVQEITLSKGRYKLQCWGAQGGTSYGSSSGAGSKGGYSEGVLNLTKKTTLYIFVGGQGSRGSSSSLVNGGWNGGGASIGYSSYNSSGTKGYSYPACGGGATDISIVTSDMSYSSGRTNRSAASLLARCIVAGGGAGGSYRYTSTTTTSTTWVNHQTWSSQSSYYDSGSNLYVWSNTIYNYSSSTSYRVSSISPSNYVSGGISGSVVAFRYSTSDYSSQPKVSCTIQRQETTSSTSTSSGYSNQSQQGGGTSGKGQYPGTQSAAGSGGGFGYGANQTTTGYRYCAGGGGGGWYGGGTACSDSSTSYINYSGGGSGFVNTAANASYRPSGYTGLELESGTTTDGNASHPSVEGGTETGHSGNGYCRITVLNSKYTTIPYIESTGTQYIDTGFKPKYTSRVVVDISDAATESFLFGARNTNSNTSPYQFGLYILTSSLMRSDYFGENKSSSAITPSERTVVDKNMNVATGYGQTITNTAVESGELSYNLYLFALNSAGTTKVCAKVKMYSCQIYDNNVLVRDFVPKLSPDGVAGLWDNVNKVFYKSAGSSEFIAGT